MPLFNEENIVDARRFAGNAKATIQSNGRLGFSAEAAKLLALTPEKKLLISDIGDGNLAGVIEESGDSRGFRIQKAGDYYYVKMKNFFDSQEVEYVANRVIYDIRETKENFEGAPVFRFSKRIIQGGKDSDDDNE